MAFNKFVLVGVFVVGPLKEEQPLLAHRCQSNRKVLHNQHPNLIVLVAVILIYLLVALLGMMRPFRAMRVPFLLCLEGVCEHHELALATSGIPQATSTAFSQK